MKAKGVSVWIHSNTPGFTLPTNIGELGDGITTLDLCNCSLTGTIVCPVLHTQFGHGYNRVSVHVCTVTEEEKTALKAKLPKCNFGF